MYVDCLKFYIKALQKHNYQIIDINYNALQNTTDINKTILKFKKLWTIYKYLVSTKSSE